MDKYWVSNMALEAKRVAHPCIKETDYSKLGFHIKLGPSEAVTKVGHNNI